MSEQDLQRIMVRQRTSHNFDVRLARPITEPDDFAEEFQLFANAGPEDRIKLKILSPGGSVDTCIMLTKAMRECEAPIIGWIGPTCASAGSAIALACDEWEVDDMSTLMIHNGSFGPGWGKAKDILAYTQHTDKMLERYVRLTYTGFLSEEEIVQVIDGKELYFDIENGLIERLISYAKYREEQESSHIEEEVDISVEEPVESTT